MTLPLAIIQALTTGPKGRPELECYATAVGYAPAGVPNALWQLKRAGVIVHAQRASRYRKSLYALKENHD